LLNHKRFNRITKIVFVGFNRDVSIAVCGRYVLLATPGTDALSGWEYVSDGIFIIRITEDIGKLGAKAVEKVADEFLDIIQVKFTDIVNNGRSINVDFSFEQTATISMSTEIGNDGLTLSDQLELWMSKHAYKNNYHIQGTTDKRMIFDDVRIPLKDDNGNNYNINKFGLEFLKFARSIGLQITRSTANNTLVITFK
jgi:hypothetical protein